MAETELKRIEKLFKRKKRVRVREEIEIKFIIPKSVLPPQMEWVSHFKAEKYSIEQYYLSGRYFEEILNTHPELKMSTVDEIRIRQKNEKYIITAKGNKSAKKYIRQELEKTINANEYNSLKSKAFCRISKCRYSFNSTLASESVHVDMDDYIATGNEDLNLDFVTCEVEVSDDKYAKILISGKFFIPGLIFLRQGIHTVYESGFSNRELAENGFPATSYKAVLKHIRKLRLNKIENLAQKAARVKKASRIFSEMKSLISSIQLMDNPPTDDELNPEGIGVSQNIIEGFKFPKEQSLGSEIATPRLDQLDKIGKGWLQDFHTIVTSIPFRRLYLKPQVFRVNEGSVDTTTRGTHTMDVISVSQQLCNHLGLNVDFASAIAALHDIGHPPLGHVGEETLYKLSGKKFHHHIFSLSLTEIFNMNLLKEILLGSALHKTGGAPVKLKNHPLEITIVRIADKISYVSRDVFDGIRNGYLKKSDFPEWIFDTLGDTSEQWFEVLIDAVVRECSLEHSVNFSENSGQIYHAYKKSRDTIYEKLHESIHWTQARLNLEICYRYNDRVFSDEGLDPVVISAYMTDEEVNRLANLIESSPVGHTFAENVLEARGFGFLEIVNKMREPNFDKSRIYYSTLPRKLILKRGEEK